MRTLACIGGGLTSGLGDREALGWCGRLTRQMMRERRVSGHFNLGIPHETLPLMSKRAERECAPRLQTAEMPVILLEPGHADLALRPDGRRRTDATTLDAHLDATIKQLLKLAPVIVIGPPPIREASMPYACPVAGAEMGYTNLVVGAASARFSDICAPLGVPYVDLFEEMGKAPAYMTALEEGDGVHPASNGHKLVADFIHAELVFLMDHDDAG